jgi:hypothetical protein
MKDESWTLAGGPAVPVFLMRAVTPVATVLVVSLPVAWLVNQIFAANAVHAVFGVEHLCYWRVVGLFAILFAANFKVGFHGSSE